MYVHVHVYMYNVVVYTQLCGNNLKHSIKYKIDKMLNYYQQTIVTLNYMYIM